MKSISQGDYDKIRMFRYFVIVGVALVIAVFSDNLLARTIHQVRLRDSLGPRCDGIRRGLASPREFSAEFRVRGGSCSRRRRISRSQDRPVLYSFEVSRR